ncbi:MAG: hypothetical protein ACE5JI_09220 [Acidobacteriota bacterium]
MMPYGDPDPSDPNVLMGVSVPADEESTREMAIAFAEEFAALGFDEERLMNLFRRKHYAGAHRAYRMLGEAEIRIIIRESLAVWGNYRVVVQDAPESDSSQGVDPLVQIAVPVHWEESSGE